jgi:2-oxoglutarate dehydrogenase E1 component
MGAWTFIEPNIEWVLDHIGAKQTRPRLCRPSGFGVDGDGPLAQAPSEQKALCAEALSADAYRLA